MGPLAGIKIVEMGGIGPGPFAAMLLADMGAEVIRLDRTEAVDLGLKSDPRFNLLHRSRRSVALDLKRAEGVETALRLIAAADAVIEGFRPGVMERLGLGPDVCLARNPKLVYGRMTGWGQDGPLAQAAGHDINYISLVGVLHSIGRSDGGPVPPLNLVGDFGGGALYLVTGVLAALIEAARSGKGQVVDAAMVDGAASLMTPFFGLRAAGLWRDQRGDNFLDTGAPWYEVYETKDGAHVSIGAIEGRFYAELLKRTGVDPASLPPQNDRAGWPKIRARLKEVFRTKTREEWRALLEGSDACFAPILSLAEVAAHPHNQARGTFVEVDGVVQPAPAPRFSRTPSQIQSCPAEPGQHTEAALKDWGFSTAEVAALKAAKAIG